MAKTVKIGERTWKHVNRILKDETPDKTALVKTAQRNNNIVLVQNYTAAEVPQFGILGSTGLSLLQPTDSGFKEKVVLQGMSPGNFVGHQAKNGGFFITCEPIPAMGIGRAWYSGICVVQINFINASHLFAGADIAGGSTAMLVSQASGPCAILYRETYGTGPGWAIVHHNGASSSNVKNRLLWVKLTNVATHPMTGIVQAFSLQSGVFGNDTTQFTSAQVYRYPTYNSNALYVANNVIAASVQDESTDVVVCVALDTLPAQLAVTNSAIV
jgi:hypothetical protein